MAKLRFGGSFCRRHFISLAITQSHRVDIDLSEQSQALDSATTPTQPRHSHNWSLQTHLAGGASSVISGQTGCLSTFNPPFLAIITELDSCDNGPI
jgi:hypothetical protein